MQKYKVTGIIPVYNRGAFFEEVLKSIINQSRKFDEIMVVDDSTDNTPDIIKKFKEVKYIRGTNEERIVARNVGLKYATGNIVAFIDSDLVLDKDWLKEVLVGFEKGYAAVIDRRQLLNPKTYVARMNDHFFNLRYKHYKPFAAWIFDRKILAEVGNYNEKTAIGTEDIELADRLFANGHKIYFADKAISYHLGEPKSFKEEMKRSFWFGSNTLSYWFKRKKNKRHMVKQIIITLLPITLIKPLLFLFLLAGMYFYVLVRNLMRGMNWRFLFVHPIYIMLSEFAFTVGFWYGLLVKAAPRYH